MCLLIWNSFTPADERDETDDESETTVFDVHPILELITLVDERDETDDETRPPLLEFWVSRQTGAKPLERSKFIFRLKCLRVGRRIIILNKYIKATDCFFFSVRSNFISLMNATRENNIRSYTERKTKKKKNKKNSNILDILPFQVHYQILHMQIYGNIVLILAYFHFRNKEDILETFLFKFFLHNTSVMSICKINLHEEIFNEYGTLS